MASPLTHIRRAARYLLKREYVYYQPEDLTEADWERIDNGNFDPYVAQHISRRLDRICMDRAAMIRNAMRQHFAPKGKTLLDLGCNTGFFSHYFARLDMRVTGVDSNTHNTVKGTTVDADASVIATAKRLATQYGVDATFVEAEIQQYLADAPKFDVVLCLSLFHHFFEVGVGYGVREKTDLDALFALIANRAKHLLYFEMDHNVGDAHGWPEAELPTILKEKGGFAHVNVIGLSTDAYRRYRTLYECVR